MIPYSLSLVFLVLAIRMLLVSAMEYCGRKEYKAAQLLQTIVIHKPVNCDLCLSWWSSVLLWCAWGYRELSVFVALGGVFVSMVVLWAWRKLQETSEEHK
jgi:hypothetical protein